MNYNQQSRPTVGYKLPLAARFLAALVLGNVLFDFLFYFAVRNLEIYFPLVILAFAITAVVAYLFIARIIVPIRLLIDAAERFSVGKPFIKLEKGAAGDVGVLIDAFNLMAGKLNVAYAELQEKLRAQTRELDMRLSEIEGKNKILQDTQTALLNVLEDVDREKRISENLAADLQKFRLAVDSASDHIMITDPDAKIIYANHAAEAMTGYSFEEMEGKTPALWGGQMPDEFYKQMWDTIKNKKMPFIGELQNRRKDGVVYTAELRISPILDGSGNVRFYVGVERDITKTKEIDRAKTEFVSLASHQLRTPLSIINWYSEMLLGGDVGKITLKEKTYLDEIYRTNKRMIDLVNALLNVSKIDLGTFPIEPEAVDVAAISDSVIGELEPQMRERHIVVDKKYGSMPKIEADPKIIRIIIQNLLSNAVKYSKEGGRITESIQKESGNLSITVADNGIGIPSGQQDKIFAKLFRADNAREVDPDGNGLGLYLIKSLVEQLGGRIWFESAENKGTTFFVILPFKRAEANMQKSASESKLETSTK
ncbi:MAG: ATP-binding protein [Patescibacteria group bacterium]|nr:ATP-binding protein [Patescibacteria group bacterium]MCL5261832.1 ATP-binding protein [Patescibacteria group bacterium]